MFNCGRAVGLVRDAVGMPGRASPQVGVGRCGRRGWGTDQS